MHLYQCSAYASLPVRGAWIEISVGAAALSRMPSLPVRGAWIEIMSSVLFTNLIGSLPVRGAWIEIPSGSKIVFLMTTSLPVRGAWIEMLISRGGRRGSRGRSPCGERGLKLRCFGLFPDDCDVAPRAGSVD